MKRNLFFPTLVAMVSLLAISSIGATYAWYQYQTFISVGMSGTSIDTTKIFEVGLVSDVVLDSNEFGFNHETIGDKEVYWISGALGEDITEHYLTANGYGTRSLHGTTSGKYVTGQVEKDGSDAFMLKRAPSFNDNYLHESPVYYHGAAKTDYLHFELAFKLTEINKNGHGVVQATGVRLADISFKSINGDLDKTVRVHFSNDEEGSGFIFNPNSSSDGFDTVGGVLDLLGNGVYDTQYRRGGYYETAYGEFETIAYKDAVTTDGRDISGSEPLYNWNCFEAEHQNGAYAVDLEKTEWSKSEYLGTKSVITNNKILSSTNDDGIAFFNMDIYLEGWSSAFTNDVLGSTFSCNLEFESI